MRKKILIISMILLPFILSGQEITMLSSYPLTRLYFNPGFAGSSDAASVSFFGRSQWTGFGPSNEYVDMHSPMKNDKVALGVSFSADQYPEKSMTQLYLNYAYRIWVKGGRLALGIRGGMCYSNFEFQGNIPDINDEVFSEQESRFFPNFGAGVAYYNDRLFAGISVPHFLSVPGNSNTPVHDFSNYHVILTGAYIFDITSYLKLRPGFFYDYNGSTDNYVVSLSTGLFDEFIWAGLAYKSSKALVINANVQVTNQVFMGYSVDYSLEPLTNINSWTHEIVLRWEYRTKISADSPFYY